jgi:NADPH:quinone reductase-like Zn-dependent oxidoreductase
MRAITQDKYGAPNMLRFAEVPRPRVGEREVLVQIHASAVTRGDARLRSGDFPGVTWLPGRLAMGMLGPRSPIGGTVFAGRVVEAGRRVERFAVGDAVFGMAMSGAYAEYLAIADDAPIAQIPAGVRFEEAASLPYGGGTALKFLRDFAALEAGQHVCILGASGGVGSMAVQVARHIGAEITAVCSERNHALVQSLGAQHVVDYHSQDFRRTGARFDVIFDTVGASSFKHSREALAPTGRYASLIMTMRLLLRMLFGPLLGKQRALTGVAMDGQAGMEELRDLAEQGALRPHIDRVFEFDQLAEAHAYVESGRSRGTVVVRVLGQAAAGGSHLALAS